MKIVASIEARMSSSRLPGKILREISGKPALLWIVERLKMSLMLNEIWVATTLNSADDLTEEFCFKNNINCFRGSEEDVLQRVVACHTIAGTDIIVQITGDCPLIDFRIVDTCIQTYLDGDYAVVTNSVKSSYPSGTDVQVYSYDILKEVSERVFDRFVREHVSLFFYENPDLYKVKYLDPPLEHFHPNCRLQLDYEEDLELIQCIYSRLLPKHGPDFGLSEVLNELRGNPDIMLLNDHCIEKDVRY